jgi:hypothetical protein
MALGVRQTEASARSHHNPLLPTLKAPDPLPPLQVVKRLWEYIKEKQLQDPKDKRRILLDDKLSTIFPGKFVTMFSMNKHLSRHCKVDGESVGGWAPLPRRAALWLSGRAVLACCACSRWGLGGGWESYGG